MRAYVNVAPVRSASSTDIACISPCPRPKPTASLKQQFGRTAKSRSLQFCANERCIQQGSASEVRQPQIGPRHHGAAQVAASQRYGGFGLLVLRLVIEPLARQDNAIGKQAAWMACDTIHVT